MTPVERVRKIALLPRSKPPATAPILPPSQVTPLWKIKAAVRKIKLLPAAPIPVVLPQTLASAVSAPPAATNLEAFKSASKKIRLLPIVMSKPVTKNSDAAPNTGGLDKFRQTAKRIKLLPK